MKFASALLFAALAALASQAEPSTTVHLTSGQLSLDAPAGSVLRQVASGTWELHNHDITLGISVGSKVADADDAEPRRCYATEILLFDGGAGVLRTTRRDARADCPEDYASLYMPPDRPGAAALFLWSWGADLPAVRAVIRSIRIAR